MLTFRDANREFGIIFLSILILIMYKRLSESEFTELKNWQDIVWYWLIGFHLYILLIINMFFFVEKCRILSYHGRIFMSDRQFM